MDKEDEIIKEDRLQHPNCSYARSLQQSCSNKNGEFTCETIKKINRMCPNERPVVIFSENMSQKGSKDVDIPFDPFDLLKDFGFGESTIGRPPGGFPSMPPIRSRPSTIPQQPESGFQFKFGGSLVDDDEGGSSSLLERFGFGSSKTTSQKGSSKMKKEDPPKPPAGTSLGPSEDI